MAQKLRTFHVDTGRKYFSPEEMEDFMTQAAANGYNSMEICIGNCGWRFLLDDMTIETEGKTYGSEAVKAAFRTGNRTYCDSGRNEWTEEEMIRMLAFAGEKGLEIIPLMDSPGHMEATLTAMKELGIRHPSYQGSVSAMDLENPEVTAFVRALMESIPDGSWTTDANTSTSGRTNTATTWARCPASPGCSSRGTRATPCSSATPTTWPG